MAAPLLAALATAAAPFVPLSPVVPGGVLPDAGLLGGPTPVLAQDPPRPDPHQDPFEWDDPDWEGDQEGWNSRRTLELVERGREARARAQADEELATYRAQTTGHVYFYVDPEVQRDPILIRVDQVAVDHFWRAPGETHQVVVGHRSEKRLPVRDFQYFLDRLTLVQYGFDDIIEVGHGSDVRGVAHPLAVTPAPGQAGEPYDYRIADSVTVTLPGEPEPVRIYQVDVRPRDPAEPGFVGSVYLDRASASIVRMEFTFTPASYQDPRNDRVRVSLGYGLWEGRYWLPHEQTLEVRREMPQLDLGAGTVIRAVLRVGDYRFNVPVDHVFDRTVSRTGVTLLPEEERRAYPFEEGLLDRLADEGLEGALRDVDPGEVQRMAREAGRQAVSSGLPPLRLHLPALSSVLRYNRAEGWAAGGGVTYRAGPSLRIQTFGGYAFGANHPTGTVEAALEREGSWALAAGAGVRSLQDLGVAPGSAAITNTLTALAVARDDLDPFFRDRVHLDLRRTGSRGTLEIGLEGRRDRSATLVRSTAPLDSGRQFRPVTPIDDGDALLLRGAGTGGRELSPLLRLRGSVEVEAGRFDGDAFARAVGEGTLRRPFSGFRGEAALRLRMGSNAGAVPRQHHFLLGGRGTLPGYEYRAFGGEHFALLDATLSRDLAGSMVRGHLMAGAGWTGGLADPVAEEWETRSSAGLRPTAGLGVGLYHDLLRVDLSRGLRAGRWGVDVYLDRRWWDQL